jgi:subtilisin family serine protease
MNLRFQLSLAALAVLTTAFAQNTGDAASQGEGPEARRMLEQISDLRQSPTGILVRFRPGTSENDKAAVRASLHAAKRVQFDLVPGLELVETSMGAGRGIAALLKNPHVLYAQPDFVVRPTLLPNDPSFPNMWNLNTLSGKDINAPEAWDLFTGDPNFVIADIDTGAQWDHPDLAANIFTNTREIAGNGVDDDNNGYVDDIHGWNFYGNNNDPSDQNSHGTHTAGTIGAVGNNGMGVTGINWRCKILPLKFLGPDGGYISDAIRALQYAVRMGVKVSNNSYGGPDYDQAFYDAISAARGSGHLFVAAAGNSGTNNDSAPFYPAAFTLDNVISVAATDSSDNRAGFSNYGATSVDLGAPGVGILSTMPGNGFGYSEGTSMAAPHVTGVAALLFAKFPTWTYQQVRDRIFSTVRPASALMGTTKTGGVLDAFAAINVVTQNTAPTVTIASPSAGTTFSQGATVTFSGSATDQEDGNISARLVWTSSLQGQIGAGASFSRSDLIPGTHTVVAVATDNGGLTSSKTVQFTVTMGAPFAPSNPAVVANGDGSATVRWQDNSNNETTFEIEREQRARRYWKYTTTAGTVGANVTSFTDRPGLGNYHYRVRAVNASGASAWTAWVQVKL